MAGKVLDIETLLTPDNLGCEIARQYQTWENLRNIKVNDWAEIQKYIFATDTTTTTNAQLPWKNKTTLPKLCQIRDNLYANYMAALFPKRKWLYWEGFDSDSQSQAKRKAIEAFAFHIVSQPQFRDVMSRLVLDYIDYGNVFPAYEWVDNTVENKNKVTSGYVGPLPVRLSPLDIVFNPTSSSFYDSPKITRSLITIGEFKSMLEATTPSDSIDEAKAIFDYMIGVRQAAQKWTGSFKVKNELYNVAGFSNFAQYLGSNYVEVLTCYGDYYDVHGDEFYKDYVITVVDRHKVVGKRPNPSYISGAPIYHAGWRIRQDNLWAMGPLDNLVGMQYRIDHVENLKADVFDLIAAPPLVVTGLVHDFEWGPFARINVGDDGKVEVLAPDVNALNANLEIAQLQNQMEEMAGSPKEAAGFRTPGEKTAYEVQRLENAASRIFLAKTQQFEEQVIEKLLNGMLEMARRKMGTSVTVRVFDDELQAVSFMQITPDMLTGSGRIRPVAARNFAERAERVQNLNNFFASVIGQDPDIKAHFSSIKLAQMFEDLLDISDYSLVQPYVRLTEEAQAQQLQNTVQEHTAMTAAAPSGLTPDDTSNQPPGIPGG